MTLVLAYGIDQWMYLQLRSSRQTGSMPQYYLLVIAGGLLLGAIWLGLSWISLKKAPQTIAVSMIFIIVGLLAFIWYPLEYSVDFVHNTLYIPFRGTIYNFQ